MNWDDPTERLSLLEKIGTDAYNRALNEYIDANPIRLTMTRFGMLHVVGRTGRAFSTRKEAEEFMEKGGKP